MSATSSKINSGQHPPEEITCQELVELVTAYLEQVLPDDERKRFEEHIAQCGACREYLQQMRHTIQATGALSESSLEPRTRDELLKAFRTWKAS